MCFFFISSKKMHKMWNKEKNKSPRCRFLAFWRERNKRARFAISANVKRTSVRVLVPLQRANRKKRFSLFCTSAPIIEAPFFSSLWDETLFYLTRNMVSCVATLWDVLILALFSDRISSTRLDARISCPNSTFLNDLINTVLDEH